MICVDVDDVLVDYVGAFIPWMARRGVILNRNEIKENLIESGVSMKDIEEFASTGILYGLPIIPGSDKAIAALRVNYDFVAVTSRPMRDFVETDRWVFGHFGIPTICSKQKGDVCRELGAILLIEDQGKYAKQFSPSIILAAPWNVGWEGFRGNWYQIAKFIKDKSWQSKPITPAVQQ